MNKRNLLMVIIFILLLVICAIATGLYSPDDDSIIYNNQAILERSDKEKQTFQNARTQSNQYSYLNSVYEGRLEDRVRAWFKNVGRELETKANIEFLIVEKDSDISLEIKGNKVEYGQVIKGEVFVKISNDKTFNGKYALCCLNGMLKDDNLVFKSLGRVRNYPFSITLNEGEGLEKYLTPEEAIEIATKYNLPTWKTKKYRLVIKVLPGDKFVQISPDSSWEYVSEK